MARWTAIMETTPKTACDASQSSRNHYKGRREQLQSSNPRRPLTKNSKKAIRPIKHKKCANAAMTDANFFHFSIIGPKNNDTKNKANNTPAFQTTGPTAMTAIRMSGLGFWFPFWSGNDLTNIYAITKMADTKMGQTISENTTALQLARGTSPESFSDGWPSFFFL